MIAPLSSARPTASLAPVARPSAAPAPSLAISIGVAVGAVALALAAVTAVICVVVRRRRRRYQTTIKPPTPTLDSRAMPIVTTMLASGSPDSEKHDSLFGPAPTTSSYSRTMSDTRMPSDLRPMSTSMSTSVRSAMVLERHRSVFVDTLINGTAQPDAYAYEEEDRRTETVAPSSRGSRTTWDLSTRMSAALWGRRDR